MVNRLVENIKQLDQLKTDPTVAVNGIIANTVHILVSMGADVSQIETKLQEIQQSSEE